ncbi:MAG: cation:proton antiporter [Candidatus Woesearchaeota archaeon]
MEQELITLGILFAFALVGGILAARFKQPTLIGLLVVGALIGPRAFGLINNENMLEMMIEFGAILMLFLLGLEFDLTKLKKIGMKAILIAVLNSAILTFAGFSISILLGFTVQVALFIGVILAFGSTVVIVKILENKGLMDRQEVPLLIAILIIEDILAVTVITFFSGIQDKSIGLFGNIENLLIAICILILTYILFVKVIRPLLVKLISKHHTEEIITFLALAMCAGFAYYASLLKLSPAVGAFLAGSIIASLPYAKGFQKAIDPYNLIVSSFFFIAIGTLINIQAIIQYIWIIITLVVLVFIIKMIAFSGMVYFFANMKGDRMFFSSIAMFSIGEFSLLVAKESTKFNVGVDLISIAAAIVAISAILMSLLINHSHKLYDHIWERTPWTMKKNMDKLSHYIRSFSDELDLENNYSQALRKHLSRAMIFLLIGILVLFGWRKLGALLATQNVNALFIIGGTVCIALILAMSLIISLHQFRKVFKTLSEIFNNATDTQSVHESKTIIIFTFTGFVLFLIALIIPFGMFLLNTSKWFILNSWILIAISIWMFRKVARSTNDHGYEHTNYQPVRRLQLNPEAAKAGYKQYNDGEKHVNAKQFNAGWKNPVEKIQPSYKKISTNAYSAYTPRKTQTHEFHEGNTKKVNEGWKF